jgi:hypothetical protein
VPDGAARDRALGLRLSAADPALARRGARAPPELLVVDLSSARRRHGARPWTGDGAFETALLVSHWPHVLARACLVLAGGWRCPPARASGGARRALSTARFDTGRSLVGQQVRVDLAAAGDRSSTPSRPCPSRGCDDVPGADGVGHPLGIATRWSEATGASARRPAHRAASGDAVAAAGHQHLTPASTSCSTRRSPADEGHASRSGQSAARAGHVEAMLGRQRPSRGRAQARQPRFERFQVDAGGWPSTSRVRPPGLAEPVAGGRCAASSTSRSAGALAQQATISGLAPATGPVRGHRRPPGARSVSTTAGRRPPCPGHQRQPGQDFHSSSWPSSRGRTAGL